MNFCRWTPGRRAAGALAAAECNRWIHRPRDEHHRPVHHERTDQLKHPAVTRPGRCLAEIEFTALAADEANRWLAEAGSEVRVAQPATIAECYSLLEGRSRPRRVKQYGFAA